MRVNLQSFKRMAVASCAAVFAFATASATDIHVATTGNDSNDGTETAPLATIGKALEQVQAGDRILIHEGTYNITKRLKIPALPTNPDKRCEMRAYPDDAAGKVIIDGTNMTASSEIEFKQSRCIYVDHQANYWTFYGLVLQHALDNGMKMEGSYNRVERCVFRYNNDTGLQIGMYKDWKIEETKSLGGGTPEFNPGYKYCRGNEIINCDSYENADLKAYGGKSDDGGDADGFAVKLFPGPGTKFYGCRAWNNSDDNWDLYMTYHPVVIDHCWAYHAGYYTNASGNEVEGVNGNGFKLGGGGSAGGGAFDQSTGAHVVTNCVSFDNLHKGFDQNNAFEGMYVINCTAWGNEYNYRFPTYFMYGSMTIRNSIGWGAKAVDKKGNKVGNHEFLSPGAEAEVSINGSTVKVTNDKTPDTEYNSWTDLDGCHIIKESYKPDGQDYTPATKDHSGEFLSLSVADFKAEREADGSLPNNNFARLKPNSIFKDAGTPIIGFTPARKMTEAQCTAVGLEYITADDLYIPYNDAAPDLGAYETDGVPFTDYVIPEKIVLTCSTANSTQEVMEGKPITDIVYEWNDVATSAEVENLPTGLSYNIEGNTLTISGTPTESGTFTITAHADATSLSKPVTTTGIISLVTPFKVLTGDWYHFQDELDALPTDLQGVLEQIAGSSNKTSFSTTMTETDGTLPGGCTEGGFSIGRSNGGIRLNLAEGLLQLKVNLHFTGDRTFKINWKLANGNTDTYTTEKMKKTTLTEWNVLSVAGITEEVAKQIRSIEILNAASGGEARIYDMYVRVPDYSETAISNINVNAAASTVTGKFVENGRIVVVKNGVRYDLLGRKL